MRNRRYSAFIQHLRGRQRPGLQVLWNPWLSSWLQHRQVADSSSLSHSPRVPESTAFFPFNTKSRDSALSLGVSQDPVSLLSIWQQEQGQFLSSPFQAHILTFPCSALEETANHSQRWGSSQPLSPTPTPKFFLRYPSAPLGTDSSPTSAPP